MNRTRHYLFALLVPLLLLGACSKDTPSVQEETAKATTAVGKAVQKATDKAREKLATENIGFSTKGHNIQSSKAQITPQGDLLIDGERIEIDEAQRALLLQHRGNVIAIAEAGIALGVQGADLGMKAATEAIKGVFSGNTDEIEKKIEAEARNIEAEARKLCELMPAMLSSQQALVESLPLLEPYATLEQRDIDDCLKGN